LIQSQSSTTITPSDEFYIKSEIKRLSKPCARLIDLRNVTSGVSFEAFEWEGMVHILDKDSAQLFVKLVKEYEGEYTFGVYEGVYNAFRKNKAKAKSQQFASDIEIDTISLSDVYSRNEERMNLGVKVNIHPFDDIPNDLAEKEVSLLLDKHQGTIESSHGKAAKTVDISLSGLQIKHKSALRRKSFVFVRFTGLEDDFLFKRKYIAYEVVKSLPSNKENEYIVALKQVDSPVHSEFRGFTKRLIYANKRRYKVNLDNTVKSVRSKLYEQFYLSRRNSLDVFVSKDTSVPYMLASDPCLDMIDWFTQQHKENLSSLIMKDNLAGQGKRELYWVVLKKKSSKSASGFAFYSTILSSELSYKFLAYALRTGMGKVFKVSVLETKGANPFLTSSLPRSVHKQMGSGDIYRYAPHLKTLLGNVSNLVTLKEVTNDQMDIFDTHSIGITKSDLAKCSAYHLNEISSASPEIVRLESNEFRKEDRFSISTSISTTYKGQAISGMSLDISGHGIAMKMDNKVTIKEGSELKLRFCDHVDTNSDFDLSNVPYKVISHKDGILRLEALTSKGFVGVKFWNKYITDNIDSLKILGAQESLCGLRRSLRNIVSQLHTSVPAFFTVKESRPCIRTLGISDYHSHSPLWSSIYSDFTVDTQLKPFLYHKAIFRKLVLELPEIRKAKPFKNYFLLVKYQQCLSGKLDIKGVTFLPDEKVTEELRKELSEYHYDYRIFNVSLTKKSRLFDRYFKEELKYLESYSPHKANKLLFEIKTLTGVLDFDDVTPLMVEYLNANS